MPATTPRFPDARAVLCGDIGGTHARFRIARGDRPGEAVVERVLAVADHPTFADALAAFLAAAGGAPRRAAFAVAGPVEGTRARLTNAPWTIDAEEVGRRFGIDRVRLVNDFEGAAAGIAHLAPQSLVPLQRGERHAGAPRLVIGAGTGLGVAFAVPDGDGLRVLAGEGGHVPFAPQDDEQRALHAFVASSLGRVTAEHLLCGAGLERLHAFARARAGLAAQALPEGAASVTTRAGAGDAVAGHAIALFCSILGAVAGDHALTLMTRGGVFVAGGIAPRIAGPLADGRFVSAFRAKGVHAALMVRFPVDLVVDPHLGLTGAAALAAQRT